MGKKGRVESDMTELGGKKGYKLVAVDGKRESVKKNGKKIATVISRLDFSPTLKHSTALVSTPDGCYYVYTNGSPDVLGGDDGDENWWEDTVRDRARKGQRVVVTAVQNVTSEVSSVTNATDVDLTTLVNPKVGYGQVQQVVTFGTAVRSKSRPTIARLREQGEKLRNRVVTVRDVCCLRPP
jgi:magnesium-transporting ATPase (P-type)